MKILWTFCEQQFLFAVLFNSITFSQTPTWNLLQVQVLCKVIHKILQKQEQDRHVNFSFTHQHKQNVIFEVKLMDPGNGVYSRSNLTRVRCLHYISFILPFDLSHSKDNKVVTHESNVAEVIQSEITEYLSCKNVRVFKITNFP